MDDRTIEPPMAESSYQVVLYPAAHIPDCYRSLIYSKWLRSLRYGNDYFKLIDADGYFSAYNRYIGLILQRPRTVVRLAVLSDEPDVALGFSVIEDLTLHYCHVHKDQRLKGIGTSLVPSSITHITHLTKTGLIIWNNKLPEVIFNPFL